MRTSRHPRKPWSVPLLLTAAASLVSGGFALATAGPADAAGPAIPAHFAAPYLQISTSDSGDMAADMAVSGDKYYTLAFLVTQSGCTPDWEDGGYSLGTFNSQIASLQAAGGNVIISSGGAGATEIAETCTNVSSLTAAYLNEVNTTGATRLDFDIEDSNLANTAATSRRDQALAALQAEDPAVQVDFTLGVSPSGLPSAQYAVLQDAQSKGVKVSTVNIMTMDFGAGTNDLAAAESAAQGTASQLSSLYGISTTAAYNMMGLTPIAGVNDDGTDFSISNASSLESFAASNGVQELSFWEVDGYDKGTGYQYSTIFNKITTGGGGGTPPPTGATGPITGYEGLCLDDRSASTADFNPVQVYTCNGTNAQSWTVESNGTLQVLGGCLDVAGAGTTNGTLVDYYPCNGTGAQSWVHESNGELVNTNSGKCLDDTGYGGSGTQVQIWTCDDTSNQQWNIP
jgi:chitinase